MLKNSLNDILEALKFALLKLQEFLKKPPANWEKNLDPDPEIKPEDRPMNQEDPKPVPPAQPEHVALKWDTPKDARHSTRVICDEEGLKWDEKNLICAVIMAESGFNNGAKCLNKNKAGVVTSTDWGICQINDYWHIGQGKSFPSVDFVLKNPDRVVRWMIKMYRGGSLKLWVAYTNGSYKKYLA